MIRLISAGSVLEVVVRTIVIFVITFAAIRLRGNKQLAQLSVFDALLVIALGSAVGDVIVYPEEEVSLLRSAVAICTLVALVFVIEFFLARAAKGVTRFFHGRAVALIRNGKVNRRNIQRCNLTEEQLRTKLRERNLRYFSEARLVCLEPDGEITVIRKARTPK